jgi:hypothetical protein
VVAVSRRIGERVADQYVYHPAASTGHPLSNGYAVDSGTVMLLESNLHTLSRQSLRPLVQSVGVGQLTQFPSTDSFWDGLTTPPPALSERLFSATIPWDRRTAMRFGPFWVVQDYELDDARLAWRPVKLTLDITVSSNVDLLQARAYFAITATSSSPASGAFLDFDSVALSAGQQIAAVTLTPSAPIAEGETFRCRPDATAGAPTVRRGVVYLWFGWGVKSSDALNYVNGMSAFEVDA